MTEEIILTVLRILTLTAATSCAILGWTFVALYSRTTWKHTLAGRHLLCFTAALAATFTLAVAFAFVPVPPVVRGVLAVTLYSAIAIELWRRIVLFRAAQREHDDT